MKTKLFLLFAMALFSCQSTVNDIRQEYEIEPRSTFTISGTIYWHENQTTPVRNVTVTLSGMEAGTVITDSTGTYSFTVSTPGTYRVTPTKNLNLLNGVTSTDATAVFQHVNGTNPITNLYRQVAADVNRSNSITNTDVSLINGVIQGNSTALAVFNKSWRFVPTTWTMGTPPWGFPEKAILYNISSNQVANFYGIKLGDVNGSCDPYQ